MIKDFYVYNGNKFKSDNLEGLSQEMIQTVYNVCRILYDSWDTSDSRTKRRFTDLITFFEEQNQEKLFADTFTIEEEKLEKIPVMVFKIALYRFYKEHLPKIMETLTESDWKNGEKLWNSFSLLVNVKLEKWEKPFWLLASGQTLRGGVYSGINFVKIPELYGGEEKKEEQETIKEITELAMKHKDAIEEITRLQQKYMPYLKRAENLNCAAMQCSEEQRKSHADAIQNVRNMLDVLEINLEGGLDAGDIMEVEKIIPEIKEQVKELTGTINNMYQNLE